MKRFDTYKLFYGRYPYKLVWNSPISHWYRGADLPYIRDTLDELQHQYNQNNKLILRFWNREVSVSTLDLYYAQKVYSSLCQNPNHRLRVEGTTVAIYSEEKDWLEALKYNVGPTVEEWWEPATLLQPNTIIMSEAMKGWEYRITFKDKLPEEFKKWALNNLDKIKIGPILRETLEESRHSYVQGLYFYVKSEKMLSMVSLILGGSISRIDKIVIEDENA